MDLQSAAVQRRRGRLQRRTRGEAPGAYATAIDRIRTDLYARFPLPPRGRDPTLGPSASTGDQKQITRSGIPGRTEGDERAGNNESRGPEHSPTVAQRGRRRGLRRAAARGGNGRGAGRGGAEGMRGALCRDARPGGRVVPISLGVSLTRGSALRRGFRTGPSSRPKMQ